MTERESLDLAYLQRELLEVERCLKSRQDASLCWSTGDSLWAKTTGAPPKTERLKISLKEARIATKLQADKEALESLIARLSRNVTP